MAQPFQQELDFGAPRAGGLDQWHENQRRNREELARRVGLPLGAEVEVWLQGGVRLRGTMRLADPMMLDSNPTLDTIRLEVSAVPFSYREMESCVRT